MPFSKLYPSSDMSESMLATTRDALYGWTAERLVAKQTAPGAPSFLYYFDHGYPAADAHGAARLSRQRAPVMSSARPTRRRALWPKVPATPVETQLSDAMLELLGRVRARRRAERGGPAAVAGRTAPSVRTWPSKTSPRPKTHLLPGMYELNETGRVPAPRKGGIPWNWNVGLASPPLPRRGAAMPMIDGAMQSFALTLDKFLEHAAKWHPARRGRDGARGRPRRSHRLCRAASSQPAACRRCSPSFGVRAGDRVATLAWNTQAHVEVWYAIMGMGAVCHTLNPRLTCAQLAAMVAQSEARVLVVERRPRAAGAQASPRPRPRSNAWC